MIHTQTQIDNLIELAIIQRVELKKLVESLPELRTHLSVEIERNLNEIEPAMRDELQKFLSQESQSEHAKLGNVLKQKIAELSVSLEDTTAAKYSVLMAERAENDTLLAKAEARIAEAASALPNAVKEIVTDELSRFPRAGEIDQLRKEFAEPKGLNPRGKWESGVTYYKLDLVAYNGDSYVANEETTQKPSRNSTKWTLNSARGAAGSGNSTTLAELTGSPANGQILIGSNGAFVNADITAGDGIAISTAAGFIEISADGGTNYQGTWNAATNNPALASSVGTKGYYYVVNVDGSTNLNGITDWKVGDWAIYNGTIWQKVDNSESVTSVFGRVGSITAVAGDYSATQITNTAAGSITATNVQDAINELDGEKLAKASNLSDVASVTTSRTNLGVTATGADTTYAYRANNLNDLASVTSARTNLGLGSAAVESATFFLQAANSLSDVASVALARSNLGLGSIATQSAGNVSITGGSISGITDLAVADGGTGASTLTGYVKGSGTAALTASSTIPNTDITGLGTMSTQNAASVTITGGTITGITDLAIADGGTGASNTTDARTNLGLGSAAVQSATYFLQVANNLSDVASVALARTNLGLGNSATRDVGTTAGTVAAGDDARFTDSRTPTGPAGGDLTGTYPNPSLTISGVTAGGYGSASSAVVITLDSKGRATSASAVNIQIAESQVTNLVTDLASKIPSTEKGANSGVATLDSGGKIPLTQLPDSILGQVTYMGTWNASTNSPTLANPPATTTLGDYYIVTTGGTFASITFNVGDWIISNGADGWAKVDNTDAVASVFGRTGTVTATNGDYTASNITNVPAGGIVATEVQAAINELDGDKLAKASNLSDLVSPSTARTNLGLGSAATQSDTYFLQVANNLSDLASVTTARSNLGLGTMAVQNAASVSITGGSITGITDLAVADGGTGVSTTPANGQLLIGNGTGYTVANLTAGTNIAITNAAGSVTVGITGTIALANGGTGQTTAQAAINSLAGATTSGYFLRGNGTNVVMAAISAGDVPTLNQNTTGSAATLTTPRAIYGNNFDGSAALTQVIASTYGGTGNGFTKFSGPTTAEKTFTLPDSSATLLYSGGALGTPSSGTVTNLTGTASININGTVGATTPTTGVFTGLTVNDNTTLGSSNTDTINFVGRINSDFDPATDNTYDLGRVGHEWRDLYIDGTANIDSLVADTADINGGTIDGTAIGSTTPSTGAFTQLSATGVVSIDAGATNNILNLNSSNATGGYSSVRFRSGATKTAWQISAQNNVDNVFEITPSTAVGGTTFTTPVVQVSSTGLAVTGALSSTTGANFATSSGNVGIGTTSPTAKLQVVGNSYIGYQVNGTDGIYDALNLFNNTPNNTASGNGARLQFYNNSNNANDRYGAAIRSVSSEFGWSSTLVLSTALNNGFSSQSVVDAVTILPSGNVGIGTTSPAAKLQVHATGIAYNTAGLFITTAGGTDGIAIGDSGSGAYKSIQSYGGALCLNSLGNNVLVGTTTSYTGLLQSHAASADAVGVKVTGSGGSGIAISIANTNQPFLYLQYGGTAVGSVTYNGSLVLYNQTSDYRLKDINGPLTDSGSFIDALKPKVGTWKSNGSKFVGFLAHEFAEVSPSSVVGEKDAVDAEGKPVYQGMQAGTAEVIANLVAQIQELRQRVAALESN